MENQKRPLTFGLLALAAGLMKRCNRVAVALVFVFSVLPNWLIMLPPALQGDADPLGTALTRLIEDIALMTVPDMGIIQGHMETLLSPAMLLSAGLSLLLSWLIIQPGLYAIFFGHKEVLNGEKLSFGQAVNGMWPFYVKILGQLLLNSVLWILACLGIFICALVVGLMAAYMSTGFALILYTVAVFGAFGLMIVLLLRVAPLYYVNVFEKRFGIRAIKRAFTLTRGQGRTVLMPLFSNFLMLYAFRSVLGWLVSALVMENQTLFLFVRMGIDVLFIPVQYALLTSCGICLSAAYHASLAQQQPGQVVKQAIAKAYTAIQRSAEKEFGDAENDMPPMPPSPFFFQDSTREPEGSEDTEDNQAGTASPEDQQETIGADHPDYGREATEGQEGTDPNPDERSTDQSPPKGD